MKPSRAKEVFRPHAHSPAGFWFCLEIICYYSGYGYSYPLRRKAEAVAELKGLIQRLENAECFPKRIVCYVSDHGGETIMGHDFQEYLHAKGIFWQYGPHNTPNYNALVERNIRTKQALQRTLHLQSGLLAGHWPLTSSSARN